MPIGAHHFDGRSHVSHHETQSASGNFLGNFTLRQELIMAPELQSRADRLALSYSSWTLLCNLAETYIIFSLEDRSSRAINRDRYYILASYTGEQAREGCQKQVFHGDSKQLSGIA
jgi:hypothetical protein